VKDRFFEVYSELIAKVLLDPVVSERLGLAVEMKSRYWYVRNLWEAAGQPEPIEAFILQHKNDLPRVEGIAS
jgi:hypothetical protein